MSEFAGIRHALDIAQQHGFAEVEIEFDGIRFSAKLEPRQSAPSTIPVLDIVQGSALDQHAEIVSPCVGYFAVAETELKPGDRVEKSQVVAIINALGLANDVESKHAGEVVSVLAKPGEPVEFGQALYKVKVGA